MVNRKYFICKAKGCDPYENLAYEDALVRFVESKCNGYDTVMGLYLWQSDHAIVFGRNQSIYKECDLQVVEEQKIKLVRRDSGGGAVYQDLGNLNYSFICAKNTSSKQENIACILSALDDIGIKAAASGRNDLIVDGKKISGTAYRTVGNVEMQHGTLLIKEDLELADKCLKPDPCKLRRKGVASVRSRIMNIGDLTDVTVDGVVSAIEQEFVSRHQSWDRMEAIIDEDYYTLKRNSLRSENWIYRDEIQGKDGRTISGTWGTLTYRIVNEEGCLKSVWFDTDTMNADFWDLLFDELTGVEFAENSLQYYEKQLSKGRTEEEKCMIAALMKDLISVV